MPALRPPVKPEERIKLALRGVCFCDCCVAVAHQTGRSLAPLVSDYRKTVNSRTYPAFVSNWDYGFDLTSRPFWKDPKGTKKSSPHRTAFAALRFPRSGSAPWARRHLARPRSGPLGSPPSRHSGGGQRPRTTSGAPSKHLRSIDSQASAAPLGLARSNPSERSPRPLGDHQEHPAGADPSVRPRPLRGRHHLDHSLRQRL